MPRKRQRPSPDARANNGGVRQGTPGTPYPNRSDLRQAPRAAQGQEYGKAGAQIAAQRQIPLPAAPPVQGGPTPPGGGAAGPFATPADTPRLTDPTQRPDEPLEAGMPFGPGSGPQAMGPPPMNDTEARLRALYQAFPTPELRELIRQIDMGR
jgi:hypothetical protein